MANSLNENLTGKVVVLNSLADDLNPVEHLFLVTGGFGAMPFTQGSSCAGVFLSDGERTAWPGHCIERLATEEEVAAAKLTVEEASKR